METWINLEIGEKFIIVGVRANIESLSLGLNFFSNKNFYLRNFLF